MTNVQNNTGFSAIQAVRVSTDPRLVIPSPASIGSAGYDLQAAIPEPLTLYPGEFKKISSGLRLWIQIPGVAGFVFPQPGFGLRGLALKNLTGVIDSDFQGELCLCLWNTNEEQPITIQPFEAVAQLVFLPVLLPALQEVSVFTEETTRGIGGFGSTGNSPRESTIGGNHG
jgi:dUTP pyrophosphatase